MFELTGKKALVTGGSRGIGRGVALTLAKQGADVVINYRSNEEEAKKVAEEIQAMGRRVMVVGADISKKDEVVRMFTQIEQQWGGIDILVNNAGVLSYDDFQNITEEEFDRVVGTNLKGEFMCAQEAVKQMMKTGWGRVINIASISSGGAGVGFPKLSHYTASKAGVVGMTENMAMELGKYGINVNAIAPGAIATDMSKGTTEDQMKGILMRIPKGRIGQPADIGAAAAFLASNEADYVTGVVLYVDGGWLTS